MKKKWLDETVVDTDKFLRSCTEEFAIGYFERRGCPRSPLEWELARKYGLAIRIGRGIHSKWHITKKFPKVKK